MSKQMYVIYSRACIMVTTFTHRIIFVVVFACLMLLIPNTLIVEHFIDFYINYSTIWLTSVWIYFLCVTFSPVSSSVGLVHPAIYALYIPLFLL